jgi:hypothetical protein
VASWSHHKAKRLLSARCPAHGSLVVQTTEKRWLWKCHECLQQAGYAISRMLNGAR